jgi:hypothetical protein
MASNDLAGNEEITATTFPADSGLHFTAEDSKQEALIGAAWGKYGAPLLKGAVSAYDWICGIEGQQAAEVKKAAISPFEQASR